MDISDGEQRLRGCVAAELPGLEVQYNVRPEWLLSRKLRRLELDVFVPTLRLALEYQGWQHWAGGKGLGVPPHSVTVQRARDISKARQCQDAGIHLYGITWDDLQHPQTFAKRLRSWIAYAQEKKPARLMSVPPAQYVLRQGNTPFNPHGKGRYGVIGPKRQRTYALAKGSERRNFRRNRKIDAQSVAVRMGWYPRGVSAAP